MLLGATGRYFGCSWLLQAEILGATRLQEYEKAASSPERHTHNNDNN